MPCALAEIGLKVSTGPVVDFRLKSALRNCLSEINVPLLYPESIKSRKVVFPPDNPRKPFLCLLILLNCNRFARIIRRKYYFPGFYRFWIK